MRRRPRPRLSLLLAAALACVACEGPGARIVLGALGKRPSIAPLEDDAGPTIPDGSVLCKRDSECDDAVDCTRDVCLPPGYCAHLADHSRCDDGLVCDGFESCDPASGCITRPPLDCDDQDPCTIDRCDESAKGCVHDPRDFDRDGEVDIHCPGGTDCDDFDPSRGMNAPEICGDGVDNDCDNLVDEADCGPVPHDTCQDALDISAGGAFDLPVVGARSDYFSSCNTLTSSHDLVVTFTLKKAQAIKLIASALLQDGTGDVAVLSLERRCGDSGSELQCVQGVPGDLRLRSLPAGTYYAVITTSYVARTIHLDAAFSDPTSAPTNTMCDSALDVGAGGHFTGDFVGVADSITSPCANAGQPDLFYALTLNEAHDLELSALGTEPGNLVVSLRGGCNPDAHVFSCDEGPRVLSELHQLQKGKYVIVVEGPSADPIGYALDVTLKPPSPPPPGDDCSQPLPLMLGASQRVALTGLQDNIASSCGGAAPDAVFSLHLDSAQDLQLSVDSGNMLASVALQARCDDTRSESVCRANTAILTRVHDLAAGDYYLVVDSPTAAALTVTATPLPATQPVAVSGNDTCAQAQDIPDTGGLFSGDTSALNQDYSGNCGGGATSKDAAFRLVLTSTKHVVASIDAGFDSVLLRFQAPRSGEGLCAADALAQCNDDGGSGPAALLDEVLPAGTYYYIVDGYKDFNAGPYLFDVIVTDP